MGIILDQAALTDRHADMFTQAEHQSAGNMDKVFTTVKTSLDAAMGTLKTKDFKLVSFRITLHPVPS